MIDVKNTLTAAAVGLSVSSSAIAASEVERQVRKPNVIFIVTDDQKADEFGFLQGKVVDSTGKTSSERVLSPNLDRMAREGVYFSRHHVVSTVCAPSRYAMLTGKYPSRYEMRRDILNYGHRYVLFGPKAQPEEQSVFSVLRNAGYETGVCGKVDGISEPKVGNQLRKLHMKADPNSPQDNAKIRRLYRQFAESLRKDHQLSFADGLYVGNVKFQHFNNQDFITQAALEFVETSAKKKKPFFLFMATTLMHDNNMRSFMEDPDRVMTSKGKLEKPLRVLPHRDDVLKRLKAAGIPELAAPVTWIDDSVGLIMQRLEKLGIAENTLLIFTSDHGRDAGKGSTYEHGTHVPLLMYWKGRTEELGPCDQLVESIDIVPTILGLAGVAPPDSMVLDGDSLMPHFEGRDLPEGLAYAEAGNTRSIIVGNWKYVAFRTHDDVLDVLPPGYKQPQVHIYHPKTESHGLNHRRMIAGVMARHPGYPYADQLYNLKADPSEKKNLALVRPEKLLEMKQVMAQKLKTVPGSFGELKFEFTTRDGDVVEPIAIEGGLDLSAPYDVLTFSAESRPTAARYTVIRYSGKRKGEFNDITRITDRGYTVEYGDGTVDVVKQ